VVVVVLAGAVAMVATACDPGLPPSGAPRSSVVATATSSVPPGTGSEVRTVLATLLVDDGPAPAGYVRDLFPTWKDIDHDGCDAREQALAEASTVPASVRAGCEVVGGHWVSAYDGMSSDVPGDLDVDHVVPLANAWASGADAWTTDERTAYANDQFDLWVVSASSNRSKGDRSPDTWRPPDTAVWCTYAQRWIAIKVRWRLRATTAEHDALGQMLDTC
jgi:hypothetical protein